MYKSYFNLLQCILFLSLFSICTQKGISQVAGAISEQEAYFNNISMSPQSNGFIKQGNHTMNLFNGQILFQIPIYTFKDKDFNIPISLTYNSSGFMPNQREGIVGLGWSLNAGAGITRVVNGVPDDCEKRNNPDLPNGLLYGVRNNLAIKFTHKDSIFELKAGTIPGNLCWNIGSCEAEPDLYSINVPGLSGKFYIENNGQARTIGNKPFKVDLSGVGIQLHLGYGKRRVEDSEMVLTTDDGFTYYFGGDISKLDVMFSLVGVDGEVSDPVINTWHLTKIVAPSGQTVEYKYRNYITGIIANHRPGDSQHYLLNVNYLTINEQGERFTGPMGFVPYDTSFITTINTVTKTTYLEEILVPGKGAVKFLYRENEKTFYRSVSLINDRFDQHNLRLNRIEVIDHSDRSKKEFEFTQTYWGGYESRLFLSSFKAAGENPYLFTYYDTSYLPLPTTAGVDHWGYWNDVSAPSGSAIPNMVGFPPTGDVNIVGTERETNISKCKTAMLAKVIYPTKGYTLFDYEPHRYSKRLERRSDYNFLPKLYDTTGYVGGARISKITDSDGINNFNAREFKYTKDYPSSSSSSGILLQWPRYWFYWNNYGLGERWHSVRRSTSFNNTYLGTDHFIQYSEVTEVTNGNGYTNYLFTDYLSNPDELNYNTLKLSDEFYGIVNIHLLDNYVGIYFNDKFFERGIVKRERQYKFNGGNSYSLVRETKTNTFTGISDYPDLYLTGAHITGSIVQSFKKYYYPFKPKQVEETIYGSSGLPASIIHNYHYNDYGYLILHTASQSNSTTVKEITSYPNDYAAGTLFLDDMRSSNLLKYPIEKVKYNEVGGLKNILSGQIVKYKPGGKGLVDELLFLETSDPVLHTSFKFSNRPVGILPPGGTVSGFVPDSKYKLETKYHFYDSSGNIFEQQKSDNLRTSYIWSYNGQYPVAVVINAPVKDVFHTSFEDTWGNSDTGDAKTGKRSRTGGYSKALYGLTSGTYLLSYWKKNGADWIFQQSTISVSGSTYNINLTGQVDELRFYPSTAQMTTYTFEALVGISSRCDENNRITYYEYDAFGRLELVRDHDKKLVKKICYNYAGQPENCLTTYYSEPKSGTFTKNNCGPGYVGSQVTYTVPAKSFSSTVSQLAADQLAQDDVDINGQMFANTNGLCQGLPIAVTLTNIGELGTENFFVTFTSNGVGDHFGFYNKRLTPGSSVTNNVYTGTYDIEIEVKSGDELKFSLNGEVRTGSIVTYSNVSITSAMTIYAGVYQNTAQNVTYTRNNCPPNNTPSSVVYVVPPGSYTSLISQADANTQAISQTATAGQAYANANGSCLPPVPSTTDIVYTNQMTKTVTLKLTNTSTGVLYTFSLAKKTYTPATAGTIPTGTYDVTMKVSGASDYYSINEYIQAIPDTDFNATNVLLNTAITTVTAY